MIYLHMEPQDWFNFLNCSCRTSTSLESISKEQWDVTLENVYVR